MARMSGADLAVQISTNGTVFTSLGCFRRFSINRRKDMYDSTCASDTNKTYKPGKPDFSVNGEFVFDDASSDLFAAAEGTTAVTLRLLPNDTVSNYNWTGSFHLDYTVDAPYDGIVTGTFEARADGAITRSTTT
jgi:hypothetical protein